MKARAASSPGHRPDCPRTLRPSSRPAGTETLRPPPAQDQTLRVKPGYGIRPSFVEAARGRAGSRGGEAPPAGRPLPGTSSRSSLDAVRSGRGHSVTETELQ